MSAKLPLSTHPARRAAHRTASGLLACLVLLAGVQLVAGSALAVSVTLADRNSVVEVETGDGASPAEAFSWLVDGVEQLASNQLFVSVGGAAFQNVASLGLVGSQLSDTNVFSDPAEDTLSLRYGQGPIVIDWNLVLRGGQDGSGASDLAQIITLDHALLANAAQLPVEVSLIQYVDFDLGGTSTGDAAALLAPGVIQQSDGSLLAEEVFTPSDGVVEVGLFPEPLLSLLAGEGLDAAPGPVLGDVAYGIQWTFVLSPGETVTLSKDLRLDVGAVPEPGAALLLGLATAATLLRRASRRR